MTILRNYSPLKGTLGIDETVLEPERLSSESIPEPPKKPADFKLLGDLTDIEDTLLPDEITKKDKSRN